MNHQPEEVLKNISSFLKEQHISQLDASRLLGYGSKQTFCNVLSSKKYLSKPQAMRFAFVFPFNVDYLTAGKGELLKEDMQSKQSGQNEEDTTAQEQVEDVSAIRIVNLLHYLAVCLQDKDILNLTENIHRLVFFSNIGNKSVLDNNPDNNNGAKDFVKVRMDKTEQRIRECLTVIREKFPYGIVPAVKH